MKLYLELKGSGKEISGDFIVDYSVKVDNQLICFYDDKTYRYLSDGMTQSDKFRQIHLKKLHYIIAGEFQFQNEKFDCQLGYYLSNSIAPGFKPFLLNQYPYKPEFTSSLHFDCELLNPAVEIIDLEDFNMIRSLMGLDEFSLMDYVKLKFKREKTEKLFDYTSHFEFNNSNEEFSELSTHKGLEVFLEQQELTKKDKKK